MNKKILVVDDEESIRYTFDVFLSEEGYALTSAAGCDEAVSLMRESDFDLIYVDIVLEGCTGIDLLETIRVIQPSVPVIIITGLPSIKTAVESLRHGALDYIIKPIRQHTLVRSADRALQHKALRDEKEKCRLNLEAIFRSVKDGIITVDRTMSITEINKSALRICGVQRENILHKPLKGIATCCQGGCVDMMQEVLIRASPMEVGIIECHHSQNPRQVIRLTASPLIGLDNEFSGAVMVLRDETRLRELERDLKQCREFDLIVGNSEGIRNIKTLIQELADVQTTVLISGESGTGKELVVQVLHRIGDRRDNPLVKVNCAALSETLLESELFGHVRGAFTGAVRDKIGRFERAHGGTIFLDEIGDISPRMQSRLLRVIESGEFERVGDSSPVHVNVRVVASTNKNLKQKIGVGEFREDLYYRLKVVEIHLPTLLVRRNDIPLLLEHFINKFNRRFDRKIVGVSSNALNVLMLHTWPGNVRELENTLEHAFVRCRQGAITVDHLPPEFGQLARQLPLGDGQTREQLEAMRVRQALVKTAWNKSRAANLLGMSRRTIYRKIVQYGISSEL